MVIRQIKESDLPALSVLMESYTLKPEQVEKPEEIARMQAQGFLLGEYPLAKMIKDLSNLFLIAEENGKLAGYYRIDRQVDEDYIKFDQEGLIHWFSPEARSVFYESPHFVAGGLLVDKAYGRRGVASSLLQTAIKIIKGLGAKRLFAIIATGPVRNQPSLNFHIKNGFQEIARLRPVSNMGFENYSSSLFIKLLED